VAVIVADALDDLNLILNAEPDSAAHGYFQVHGPSLCALGLRAGDEVQALGWATALLATRYRSSHGGRLWSVRR
jgi:4-hydroxyphenylpyruvate dioxygenase